MESLRRQAEALAHTHAKLREDNANMRKIVAEYEHYCVLLENTLSRFAAVPVDRIRVNYRNGRPMLETLPQSPLERIPEMPTNETAFGNGAAFAENRSE
ncbi:MAG: hypothetical protein CL454_00470 [Acidimicrobiaceae bacterium]|nr:hypothetical protein [Acidimicrobiaceae bacterium]|tara:strand:+ start:294 stop:590 length:297 start_codon:yes stop_codon:yes gene_type:complete